MKKVFGIFIILFLVILLVACNQNKGEDYFIYSNHENSNDDRRDSLFECLDKEGIEYKVDEEKNVLIKKKDEEKAVGRCS